MDRDPRNTTTTTFISVIVRLYAVYAKVAAFLIQFCGNP